MLEQVKVPADINIKARQQNLFNQVSFYYQLKSSIPVNGFFRSKDIKAILELLNITEATFYVKAKKLIELGLLRKSELNYNLVSYDKLFGILGYSLNYNREKRRK